MNALCRPLPALIIGFCLLHFPAARQAAHAQSTYRCLSTQGSITLDGVAGTAEWDHADTMALAPYLAPLPEALNNGTISQQEFLIYKDARVRARMLWDATALYLYLWADNPHVWNELGGRDAAGFYNENTVELFADPDADGKDFIELNISTRGDITDIVNFEPMEGEFGFDIEGIEAAVSVMGTPCSTIARATCNTDTDSGWALELKIPFAPLAADSIHTDTYWNDTLAALRQRKVPEIIKEDIADWDSLAAVLAGETPAATMLLERIDNTTDRDKASSGPGAAFDGVRSSVVEALNAMVADVALFADNSDKITLIDTLTGLSPKRIVPRDGKTRTEYGGTFSPAYPLDNSGAVIAVSLKRNKTVQPETTFVDGCPIADTIQTAYRDTVVVRAGGPAGEYFAELLADSVLLRDPATRNCSLASALDAQDSLDLGWFNLALIEDLLFAGSVTPLARAQEHITRPIDIVGSRSVPPQPGDSWRMNLHCLTARPCSLFQMTYTWANVNGIATAYHQPAKFGTVEFVGTSEAVIPVGSARGGSVPMPRVRMHKGGLQIQRSSSTPAVAALFALDGTCLAKQSLGGTRISLKRPPAGTYFVQITAAGRTFSQRLVVEK